MEPIKNITGVILAGGKSTRFGSNKALVHWHGKFLIKHVTDTLRSVFNDCLLVTKAPEQYAFCDIPMIHDKYQNMGPLAGIHAALHHTGKPWIFVIGCDMPMVSSNLIGFLCDLVHDDYEAVIPWLEMGPEPLCGLYHKAALDKIELQLNNNKMQVKELFEKLSVRKIKDHELMKVTDSLQVFSNINKKQDIERLSKATASPTKVNFPLEFNISAS